ncbi:haloacid dehalogenase-like hydrolase domain-containing protein 2 [Lingula anatina]|uniref:Haloacid dehalogenase-like hydrolase domain-containing protein 2 n=1 Tax=Lingula anatina TaxID=7574 RepID=A0A1S3JDV3_LINAN|nr:haloacid dehalogenase-like hydrolase domain-containing protein 2 [Lingula anatina]|eukprot:XP_013408595.1 haloacid dehalogenase-like hydrolase domain-containing protein 2 [Lingula anatina]
MQTWRRFPLRSLDGVAVCCFRKMTTVPKVEAVLIDLSGTLHIEDTAIPNAADALKRLKSSGVKVRYVTNTTKEPKRLLHNRLTQLGFAIQLEEIFTSLTAARNLVEARKIRPLCFLEDEAKEDFEGIGVEDPNAVVVGLAPSYFNYEPLNKAFNLLIEGASLIAIHKARYYKKKDGLALGPGGFVEALEYASGVKAEVVGKPEKTFFLEALRDLKCSPQNAVMIGDDVRDDVGGAQAAGLHGILVKTGKYREGDEEKISPAPFATCFDFPAATELLINKYL